MLLGRKILLLYLVQQALIAYVGELSATSFLARNRKDFAEWTVSISFLFIVVNIELHFASMSFNDLQFTDKIKLFLSQKRNALRYY